MSKRGLGIIFLILGIVSLIGAVPVLLSGIFKLTDAFKPIASVQSPGEVSIEVVEAGTYTLWHDFRTYSGSTTVSHPPAVPGGFTFTMVRSSDGMTFPLDPTRSHNTFSSPSRESLEVGTFALTLPDTYKLTVECTGGETRAFSMTQGNFLDGMAQFGLRIMLSCLLGFFGLVLLILGIVFILLKAKPKSVPPRLA